MAGGTWIEQNKERPGAYINVKAAPKDNIDFGVRGIVTFPIPLPWGEEETIIEVKSSDLFDGNMYKKIGLLANQPESQTLREAFKNAHTALVYRINKGGAKATANIAPSLDATAAQTGTLGNTIAIVIKEKTGKFDVITLVKGIQKNIQTILLASEFKPNGWIELAGEGTLVPTAGITLMGGTDGTTSDTNYSSYLDAVASQRWHTMAIPTVAINIQSVVKTFIQDMRENRGIKVQAVMHDFNGDYEGIINVTQGYVTKTETIAPVIFTAYVAGMTAAAQRDESNTYHVINGAINFVNPLTHDEIEEALVNGKMVISRRQNGDIVIEKDINSLVTFTDEKPYDYSKNRILRTLDDIAMKTSLVWELSYIGKVDNTSSGRNIFKSEMIGYMETLQNIGAIQNFVSSTDIIVSEGENKESIVVGLYVMPADAMEKLYMTVITR